MFEVQNITQRKARKKYKCQLCGKPIFPGKEYIYETFKGDEGFQTLRRHIHCDAMLSVYNTELNYDEYYDEREATNTLYGELCEQLCDEDQREECHTVDLYGCELCQNKLLGEYAPHMLGAAKDSVRDHYDWENNDG